MTDPCQSATLSEENAFKRQTKGDIHSRVNCFSCVRGTKMNLPPPFAVEEDKRIHTTEKHSLEAHIKATYRKRESKVTHIQGPTFVQCVCCVCVRRRPSYKTCTRREHKKNKHHQRLQMHQLTRRRLGDTLKMQLKQKPVQTSQRENG